MFHFTCFDLGDPHHGIVGLIGGLLSMFRNLEKKCLAVSLVKRVEFFAWSSHADGVRQVLQLLEPEDRIARVDKRLHALLPVVGFVYSGY